GRQLAGKLVLELGKDLFQRGGPVVVKVWPALAHAAERRRIELAVAQLVGQANVERSLRRVSRWLVAGGAFLAAKNLSAALDGCRLGATKLPQRRRRLERLQISGDGLHIFLARLLPLHGGAGRFADLILQVGHAAVPGPGGSVGHAQEREHALGGAERAVAE